MGSLFLTNMASWLRAAGLAVVEYDGWKTRARSTGGYESGRPWGVMWHHTASSTSPQNDASYMCTGSPDKPIANLMVARDGTVWVLAAGATNTNGKGSGVVWSKGHVPDDSMNTYAVGMEICNSGIGEKFPQVQIDSAFAASIAVIRNLALAPTDLSHHNCWAPDRKVDPATASAVQGPWQPSSCTSSGTWELDDLVAEHRRRFNNEPEPPTPEDEDMTTPATVYLGDDLHVFLRGDDAQLWHQWYANGRWHDECLGGQIASSPTAAVHAPSGRVDVAAQGTDDALWQLWYDDGRWSPWVKLSDWPGNK